MQASSHLCHKQDSSPLSCQGLTRRPGDGISEGFFKLFILVNLFSFECATSPLGEWPERQAVMGSPLKRTNWNPMPPRLDVRLSGHRKCGFHTQQKGKVLFPNHTHKPHIYTRLVREPLSPPGLLALRPVCSEDWASAVEEVEAAGKHRPPEACNLVHMSSLPTPGQSSKVLLISGIIHTIAWGH